MHGKFNMNHPKSFKNSLVTYKILQNFPAFELWFTLAPTLVEYCRVIANA